MNKERNNQMNQTKSIGHVSVAHRLHDELGKMIANTNPGGKLLSEPELAQQLGVSRATLREAMRTFETQGMIRRRQGSGTYVTHTSHVIESGLEMLESIDTQARRIGLPVEMGDLKVETRQVDEIEEKVLSGQGEVTSISRVILAENRPVAYLIDVVPAEILPAEDITGDFGGSVLDILLARPDIAPTISRTEINAVTATPEVARLIGIQRGDVLLRFVADLYADSGQAIDHSVSYFLPGYFRFHVVRRVG